MLEGEKHRIEARSPVLHYRIQEYGCTEAYCDDDLLLATIKGAMRAATGNADVVFVDGLPGSGCSTILASLNKDNAYKYYCVDEHPLVRWLLRRENKENRNENGGPQADMDWRSINRQLNQVHCGLHALSCQERPWPTTLFLARDLYTRWTFEGPKEDVENPNIAHLNDALWLDAMAHQCRVAYLYLDVPWSMVLDRWERSGEERQHEKDMVATTPEYYDAVSRRLAMKWNTLHHYSYKIHIRLDKAGAGAGWSLTQEGEENMGREFTYRVLGTLWMQHSAGRRTPRTLEAGTPHTTILSLGRCNLVDIRGRGLAALSGPEHTLVIDGRQRTCTNEAYLKYKRLDGAAQTSLIRATEGSAGYDLYSAESKCIPAYGRETLDTGIAVQLPPRSYGQLLTKSSMAKRGFSVEGGVIDCDYRGAIKVVLANQTDEDFYVEIGQAVAQMVVLPILTPVAIEDGHLDESARGPGGFGSTSAVTRDPSAKPLAELPIISFKP